MFIFVVTGTCRVEIARVTYELAERDGMDVERATRVALGTGSGVTVVLVRAGRR